MKKAILFLFVAVAFCSSCKKDQKKGPVSAKTYQVNFNISGFTQQLVGNSTNKLHTDGLKTNDTPPLSSSVDIIYYFVYNEGGALVHYLNQPSSATNFGNFSDLLPPGNYTIIFAAGKTGLNLENFPSNNTSPSPGVGPLLNMNLHGYGNSYLPWKDTFFKKMALTVTDTNINQSVTLDRIVSELTVNVTDAIPANAYRITVTAVTYQYFFFSTAGVTHNSTPVNQPVNNFVTTFIIPDAAKGTTNYKVSLLTLNDATPSSVLINCYDASNNVLASVHVDNVVVHPNTQTILSGNLFGTNNQFGITVDAKWDPSTINISF